jgi:undecaprenyl-diphosphatase
MISQLLQLNYTLFQDMNVHAGTFPLLDTLMVFCANSLIFCWPLFLLLVWGRPLHWRKQTLPPGEVEMVQKRRAVVVWVGVACILAYVLNLLLEHMIFEPRPFVNHNIHLLLTHPADASFPSDHTAWSFAVVGMLLFLPFPLLVTLWRRRDQGWQSQSFAAFMVPLLLFIGAIVIACMIGLARVYVGLHYPVDILGGAIAGPPAALLVTVLYRLLQQPTLAVLRFAQILHVA